MYNLTIYHKKTFKTVKPILQTDVGLLIFTKILTSDDFGVVYHGQ